MQTSAEGPVHDSRDERRMRPGESQEIPRGDGQELEEDNDERRGSPRLKLNLNVEFSPEGQDAKATRLGITTNVSAGGVYFTTGEWEQLQPGQELGLRLSGLAGYGTGPLFRSLRGRAVVLRLDPPEEGSANYPKAGVAARFKERPAFEVYRWIE